MQRVRVVIHDALQIVLIVHSAFLVSPGRRGVAQMEEMTEFVHNRSVPVLERTLVVPVPVWPLAPWGGVWRRKQGVRARA